MGASESKCNLPYLKNRSAMSYLPFLHDCATINASHKQLLSMFSYDEIQGMIHELESLHIKTVPEMISWLQKALPLAQEQQQQKIVQQQQKLYNNNRNKNDNNRNKNDNNRNKLTNNRNNNRHKNTNNRNKNSNSRNNYSNSRNNYINKNKNNYNNSRNNNNLFSQIPKLNQ